MRGDVESLGASGAREIFRLRDPVNGDALSAVIQVTRGAMPSKGSDSDAATMSITRVVVIVILSKGKCSIASVAKGDIKV